jgi:hypothetical protein
MSEVFEFVNVPKTWLDIRRFSEAFSPGYANRLHQFTACTDKTLVLGHLDHFLFITPIADWSFQGVDLRSRPQRQLRFPPTLIDSLPPNQM